MTGEFFLSNWFYEGMRWFYEAVTHDYVLSIIIFTILLKLVTLPADIKQRKDSKRMSAVAPETEKLKKKYKDDPKKLQEKTAELYRKHKISPYASCLPLLLTFPIFIAFIGAMRIWANEQIVRAFVDASNGNYATFASFKWLWVNNIFQPDTGLKPILMPASEFMALPFDRMVPQIFSSSVIASVKYLSPLYDSIMAPVLAPYTVSVGVLSNGWFIMPLLAGGTSFLSSWIQGKLNPSPQQNQMKSMTYLFPLISVMVCFQSNAAFAVYWIVSNVFTLAMQVVLGRIYKNKDELALSKGAGK